MAIPTLSRPGQTLGTGDENTKFLAKFTGEVMAEFEETNLMMGLTRVKTISDGKSALFAALGTATAVRHVAGDDIIVDADTKGYLSNIKSTDREIFIDDPLIASVLVTDIDQLKQHWEARREYTEQLGRALAFAADLDIMAALLACAHAPTTIDATKPWGRDNATVSGDGRIYGGVGVSNNPYTTGVGGGTADVADAGSGANVVKFAFHAAEIMDTKNIPQPDRYLLLRPKQYYLLIQTNDIISSDYTSGSNGGLDSGRVVNIAGFRVVKTANMPTAAATLATEAGAKNDMYDETDTTNVTSLAAGMFLDNGGYNVNFDQVGALAFHKSAVGTVKLADLSIEASRETRNQADLVVASYAMGHNVLRPESACAWTVCTNVA